VISTVITSSTIARAVDGTVDRGRVADTSGVAAGYAACTGMPKPVDHRADVEQRVPSFVGGLVWSRTAGFDLLVPNATGLPAWSPPT